MNQYATTLPINQSQSLAESRQYLSIRAIDNSKLSMDQSGKLPSNRSNSPQLDFNRLTPEQQQVYMSWSMQQQQQMDPQMQSIPQQLFQSVHLQQSQLYQQQLQPQDLQDQQALIDQYYQQVQMMGGQTYALPQNVDTNDPQLNQYQTQERLPTQYDQNYLYQQWQKQKQEILQTMEPHQSLNEPNMPQLYRYFEVPNSEAQMDPYNGEIHVLTHKLSPSYKLALKVVILDQYDAYIKYEKLLQLQKQQFTHPNLINIHLIHTKKFLCLCSSTYRVCALMDHIHSNCRETLINQYFNEDEIWHILESLVEALYSIHLKGIVHGSIMLENILKCHSIDGNVVYKLHYSESMSKPNKQSGNSTYYCAPELLYTGTQYGEPTWKSDVFALGMCILALCLGPDRYQQVDQLYSTEFSEMTLQEIIRSVQSEYSTKLIALLHSMLAVQLNHRLDWIQLNQQINEMHLPSTNYVNMIYNFEVQQRFQTKARFTTKQLTPMQSRAIEIRSDRKQNESFMRGKTTIGHMELMKTNPTILENRHKRRINYKGNDYYEGEVVNGIRDGYGQYYADNTIYDGGWLNDKQHGKGTYYKDGQLIYEGSFRNGLYEGYGKLRNDKPKYINSRFEYKDFSRLDDQWLNYYGDFNNNLFHGFGSLELSNNERLTGVFRNGMPDGVGVYETIDKRKVNAQWDMGVLVRRI